VSDGVRIDRWLWAARFFKTRGLATEAIAGGRVELNGARVKPSKGVVPGDELRITIGQARRVVLVRGLSDKRGPASVAQELYEETPESIERRRREAEQRRLSAPIGADLGARPTKRDRRRLEAERRRSR
jgi:ribosome-associated heat shock protein Hsp15